MDPFVTCKVDNVVSKTAVKNGAGMKPVWDETLPFTLQNIPPIIEFVVQDEDMVSDDLVGVVKFNPLQQNVFTNTKEDQEWELILMYKEQKAGSLMIGTTFAIN